MPVASPIANSNTPPGSQLYIPVANNAYNYGDRSSPPPIVAAILTPPPSGTYGVASDPTEPKTHGLAGVTALLAMLSSCASGVTVVGIDNGFGAACAVARMLGAG